MLDSIDTRRSDLKWSDYDTDALARQELGISRKHFADERLTWLEVTAHQSLGILKVVCALETSLQVDDPAVAKIARVKMIRVRRGQDGINMERKGRLRRDVLETS